jgi:hypothetical protein
MQDPPLITQSQMMFYYWFLSVIDTKENAIWFCSLISQVQEVDWMFALSRVAREAS